MMSTPKTEMIETIVKAVTKRSAMFEAGRLADVEVAILVSDDNACLLDIHGAVGLEVKTIQGLYRTLWRMGVNVDFIATADMVSGGIGAYKAVFLPFQMAISEHNAELLAKYVAGGGVLITEACPGRYSNWGMANLETGFAPGLAEVLGCRDDGIAMCLEQDGTHYNEGYKPTTWHNAFIEATHLQGVGAFADIALPASFYVETFKVTTGTPIFMHGERVAGVQSEYGRGTAYIFGTFPSLAMMHTTHDTGLEHTLEVILKRAHVGRSRLGNLLLRRLVADTGQVWFAINPTERVVTETLALPHGDNVRNLLDATEISGEISVAPFAVEALIVEECVAGTPR